MAQLALTHAPVHSARSPLLAAGRFAWRALTTLITVLIVMVVAVAIVFAIAARVTPSDGYQILGHPTLAMASGSMTGVINTGDVAVDDPVSGYAAASLTPGQIITFRAPTGGGKLVTHRIIGVSTVGGQVMYRTKGDANNAADADPVPAANVIGLFKLRVPYAGYALRALQRPLVLGLLIAAPLLWLSSGYLRGWARSIPSNANRSDDLAMDG